jgi:F0F1-type ATP synthase assembly protein I
LGRYAGLGLQYALTIALLAGLGWWLDSHWGTLPWCLVVGAVLGAIAGFVNLVRAVPGAKSSRPPRDSD